MSGVTKFVCYIAGPQLQLRNMALLAHVMGSDGVACIIPAMSHFQDMFAKRSPQEWKDHNLALLLKCDILYRLEGESVDADDEVAYAIDHGKPVFTNYKHLVTFLKDAE